MPKPTIIESNVYMDGETPTVHFVVENLTWRTPPDPGAAEISVVEGRLFEKLEIVGEYPSKREWYERESAQRRG